MTTPLFHKIDCLSIPVPDLDAALAFYSARLGHELIWRSTMAAGLSLPGSNAELVLPRRQPASTREAKVQAMSGYSRRQPIDSRGVVGRPRRIQADAHAAERDPACGSRTSV